MGQYYKIVNLDKKEFLKPHTFDEGPKLMEFGHSSGSILTALTVLLADGNGRGGGDIRSDDPLVGSWAGDRIVVAGDYGDEGRFGTGDQALYAVASETYTDISTRAREMLEQAGEYKLE